MFETKKEIILPTKSSENILDLYKRTDNVLEKIKVSEYPLISKQLFILFNLIAQTIIVFYDFQIQLNARK